MYKTDLVTNSYFTFHMYFKNKRFFDYYGKPLDRPFVWALAYESGNTYQDVEQIFTIKEITK